MSTSNELSAATRAGRGDGMQGGHLYLQTYENRNAVIHYDRSGSGEITEAERIPQAVPVPECSSRSAARPAPNVLEGTGSVILSPDRRFLFTTNGGDNSVSSFSVSDDGKLTLGDVERTGSIVTGPSGTAKSLAYAPSSGTLFVLHAFAPTTSG